MFALREPEKLVPDKAEAAQVSKIVENLQAVEVARQKREGDVQARLAELERNRADAPPSGNWNRLLSDANRRIEVLEVSLGSVLDGGGATSAADSGALAERIRLLESKVNSLLPLSERVNEPSLASISWKRPNNRWTRKSEDFSITRMLFQSGWNNKPNLSRVSRTLLKTCSRR